MYVYRNRDLPADPHFPADLAKLGYTITKDDKIRASVDLEGEFQYKIDRNDRYNVKNREAMDECIRRTVLQRLEATGLGTRRLPFHNDSLPTETPCNEAHVPILVSTNLSGASRLLVVFGEPVQDLGIWAYRSVGEDGINVGSAVDFAKGVLGDSATTSTTSTALVLANPGQLIWHCASSRAVTQRTWEAADRPYGPWGPATTSWRNEIPGNKNWRHHIRYVLDHVVWPWLDEGKRVDIIGLSEGGQGALEYLQKNWPKWKSYMNGICLGNPLQSTAVDIDMSALTDPGSFTAFLASRGRAYVLSPDQVGRFQEGYRRHGCNCYASGEELNTECIMSRAWPDMLAWLNKLYEDPSYAEQIVIKPEDFDDSAIEVETPGNSVDPQQEG
ncbi:Uncharacterized protein PECH_008847 [Penicillium ucsense]|uniref:Arb2 domain-containing protein n=1 Tax=Penicillium ucsense TaxID=2839758 RepID=A0A8J8WAW6_9EURO|nr:Uncharacterized protein PECM_001498 [Penicillium ucsense]KAF7733909.1 Uncharacterized protein PECH_008847 [Penicillium ucsense]